MTDSIRLPPHSDPTERDLLGCLILDGDQWHNVAPIIEPKMFYRETHRIVARVMWRLFDEGKPVDTTMILDRLDSAGKLGKVPQKIVIRLADQVPSSVNAGSYAKVVREYYDQRRMIQACEDTTARLYASNGEYDSESASDDVMAVAQSVRTGATEGRDYSIKAHQQRWYDDLEAKFHGRKSNIDLGLDVVNEVLQHSVQMQRLIGLLALPKVGKSRLAAAMAGDLASRGWSVDSWYSDGVGQHWVRDNVSRLSKISTSKLDRPRLLEENEWARVLKAMHEVKSWDVNVYDKGQPNIRDIVLTTKARLAETDAPLLLVVDYVQNCTADEDTELARLNAVLHGLRALRTDHQNLLVLALGQFNRSAKGRAIPQPRDVKGSSLWEEALDHMLIYHRPALYEENVGKDGQIVDIVPDKDALKEGILWHALSKHSEVDRCRVFSDLAISKFEPWSNRQY